MSLKMHYTYDGEEFTLAMAKACVGPGWGGLVEEAYEALPDGATIAQIKEKFGGLRVYAYPSVEAITAIEARSETVCEDCGAPGKLRERWWIRTLCDDCVLL